jgi:hypothetical protein
MHGSTKRPSPALVVAIIALIVSLTGTAWAVSSLPKNSVGSRQLKSKSVTTGKIGTNAVNGSKVQNGSLTGQDIDLAKLGTVPAATAAESATRASALVDGEGKLHTAGCPAGAALVRGVCFDVNLNPAIHGVKQAADGCAAKGGYLPTVMELYSARGALNLGNLGSPPNFAITDSYIADPVSKTKYAVMAVDKNGTIQIEEEPAGGLEARYVCAYPLVR